MHAVFVASLFGGALAIVLFSLLGFAGGGHAGGHTHVSHGAAGHAGHAAHTHAGHAHAGHAHPSDHPAAAREPALRTLTSSLGWTLSWFSPIVLAGAALWFGAVGLLAEGSMGRVAVLVAIIAALVGAALVRSVLAAFVRSGTAPLQLTGEGAIATVNAAIRADGAGEVLYTLEGLHRSMPARSTSGIPIPRGATVVIVRTGGGFAWVEPLDSLADLAPDEKTSLAGVAVPEDSGIHEQRESSDIEIQAPSSGDGL